MPHEDERNAPKENMIFYKQAAVKSDLETFIISYFCAFLWFGSVIELT